MKPVSTDPRDTLAQSPMSRLQIIAVAITIGLNALDGFDVLSFAFASPGIRSEWGIDQATLGYVLSAELFGMAVGSLGPTRGRCLEKLRELLESVGLGPRDVSARGASASPRRRPER